MDLNIFIVLLLTLFTGGRSLQCNECIGVIGYCVSKEMTCDTDVTRCASLTAVQYIGNTRIARQVNSCDVIKSCENGSVNFGVARTGVSMQCCNTDLCNSKVAPEYSSNSSPNGKQCYYCDDKSCFNKLNCVGTEDSCVTAKSTDQTLKGCASKTLCDNILEKLQGFGQISCCQGNLCNSAKSITLNLLFLFWPFFFYILIH